LVPGRFIQSSGQPPTDDERFHFRPGWTAGAGIEFAFAPRWTTRLEYVYDRLATANATFAPGASTESTMGLHSVRLALDWRLHAPGIDEPWQALTVPLASDGRTWSIHGQFTYVEQGYFGFHSPYEGPSSLSARARCATPQARRCFSAGACGAAGRFYFNPELMQGFGLSDVHGWLPFPTERRRSRVSAFRASTPRDCS